MKVLALAAVALIAGQSSAFAVDCGKVVKMHAFLTRAQFQCGFTQYSDELVGNARYCAQQIGDRPTKANIRSGMLLFDQRGKERGHSKLCGQILASFPQYVRR